ncbi:hypothetical protein SOVF_174950 [Spinacia oleracea]|nr:hypothetical protein SOVF_174950 [Spinacia oleracea]
MAPKALSGPPEITITSLPTATEPAVSTATEPAVSTATEAATNDDNYPTNTDPVHPYMGLTENGSATFLTSGNPSLDFFFHVVPDTPASELTRLVELSWTHDPLLTLKLICNLRGVRGTGKSDKQGFYTAALWLHQNHPKTISLNMRPVSGFGYLKDMPEILFRLLEGSDSRKRVDEVNTSYRYGVMMSRRGYKSKEEDEKKSEEEKEKARVLRLHRKNDRTKKILERYNRDVNFQLLYDSISDVFADLLKKDIELHQKGDLKKLGFAAKWCPTIDSTYDEVTLLCESIARRLFPKEEHDEYKDLEEAHYAFKLYKSLFYEHDKKRFEGYLAKVESGKATIAAGALLPHEIVASLKDKDGIKVAELQWKRMVDDLAKKGKLNNCMAISDVSGSMRGTPMEVSVALGLLISELSEEPWKGKLITFSENPQFRTIYGATLKQKTKFIRKMDWGGSTDLQKVFDRILEVAVKGKIPEEEVIKRLFIFSDMEFNHATGPSSWIFGENGWEENDAVHDWGTDYMVIQRKFKESGYKRVPEIVFWNLRHSKATPVPSTQPGVALVSGFSKNLVTLFLEEGGILNPEEVMFAAVSKPEYDTLVVYD